ncbi:MAG: amino acid ABC transporter permease [Ruminococcus sp.]
MSFFEIIAQLGDSMLRTLAIFLLTLVFSIPLGMIVCVMRMYGWKPLQWLARIYISVLRGTPLMLQLLVVYFGPYFIFQIPLSTSYRFYAVIIAFSLNYAAYFAEIFRSGIQSIPVGQYEASRILGYNRVQMFLRIILPQVIKRIPAKQSPMSIAAGSRIPLWHLRLPIQNCLQKSSRLPLHKLPCCHIWLLLFSIMSLICWLPA